MNFEINGKKFELKELLYLDIVELADTKNKREHAIKLFELSGVTKDNIDKLTTSEGTQLMEKINEINGWGVNFQKTSQEGNGSKTN